MLPLLANNKITENGGTDRSYLFGSLFYSSPEEASRKTREIDTLLRGFKKCSGSLDGTDGTTHWNYMSRNSTFQNPHVMGKKFRHEERKVKGILDECLAGLDKYLGGQNKWHLANACQLAYELLKRTAKLRKRGVTEIQSSVLKKPIKRILGYTLGKQVEDTRKLYAMLDQCLGYSSEHIKEKLKKESDNHREGKSALSKPLGQVVREKLEQKQKELKRLKKNVDENIVYVMQNFAHQVNITTGLHNVTTLSVNSGYERSYQEVREEKIPSLLTERGKIWGSLLEIQPGEKVGVRTPFFGPNFTPGQQVALEFIRKLGGKNFPWDLTKRLMPNLEEIFSPKLEAARAEYEKQKQAAYPQRFSRATRK